MASQKKWLVCLRQNVSANIEIENRQSEISIDVDAAKQLVQAFINLYGIVTESVEIHADFFDDPTPTDCISFPIDDVVLGSIFVCPTIAQEYVEKNGGDLYREITLYTIHALLHLIGYNDIEECDRAAMREQETFSLDRLNEFLIRGQPSW